MKCYSLIIVIFCFSINEINCYLNDYNRYNTRNRREHTTMSADDNPCTFCSNFDANHCTVYEEAKVGDAEVTITVRCFKGNIFITERKMTQPNTKRGEHVQHIYTRTLEPTESQRYESQRARNTAITYQEFQPHSCSICENTRNKVWFSDDINSKLLFSSGNYLPEDACNVCNNAQANTCSVKEETSSDLRNLIVTIKCLNGNSLVNEQQKTKPNPYPNQRYQRIYSKSFHSETTSKSRFIKGGNRDVENIYGNRFTYWNSTNSDSPDTQCNECASRDATMCSVQEEINPHSLEFYTKIKCLKDQKVVWEYTKPSKNRLNGQNSVQFLQAYNITYIPVTAKSYLNQVTSSSNNKLQTKNLNPTQLIDDLCSVCKGRQSNTCSVKEGTTSDLTTVITTVMCLQNDLLVHQQSFQKINPNPRQKIERSYSQKIKEIMETVQNVENIDLNQLTNNYETTLNENPLKTYCKFCESVEQSNKCSVREETSADLSKLFTIVKCQDGETIIKDRTYTKSNPSPHGQITRWYSQSIIRSSTMIPMINTAHTKPITDSELVNQNNACLLCEHTSATTCRVDEETNPSNRLRLIITVSCLRGNHQVYKQTLDEPNLVSNEFVKRQYSETVQSSQQTSNIETLNQHQMTNSFNKNTRIFKNQQHNVYDSQVVNTRDYEKVILDDSCVICDNYKNTHMCKVEEATSVNKENIITTVKCFDSQENILNERIYSRSNPNPDVYVNRWFSRTVTTTTKLIPVQSPTIHFETQYNPSESNYPSQSIYSHKKETSATSSRYPAHSHYPTRQIPAESSHISNPSQSIYTSQQETSITNSRYPTQSLYETRQFPSESRDVHQRESISNQYTSDSKHFSVQKQQVQNRYNSNDYNTNSQHDRLVYGENHMPDKPCSICDSTSANTCSVTEETSEDTQLLVTTVKCLNGNQIVHQNQFTKTNPYPGSRIRRTHYESCGTEQTHTSNRYRSNLGIKG